jgi:hypothetical protein
MASSQHHPGTDLAVRQGAIRLRRGSIVDRRAADVKHYLVDTTEGFGNHHHGREVVTL